MNDLIKFVLPLAAAGLMACGGGSGVDGTKQLNQLTAEEVADLCAYQIDNGPSEEIMCSDTVTVGPITQAECVAGLSANTSSCTVQLLEDCVDSGTGDFCADAETATAECAAYVSCLIGG